ncbi:BET1 like protein [Argiope bruennichi]|uniref:BET1 like protein n=1 Tax=Argiope bruennichi TaxID=94029 RepID=A0A8T0EYL8_ARGBR|nr:BET1 like protein [Argiope bruennichi]
MGRLRHFQTEEQREEARKTVRLAMRNRRARRRDQQRDNLRREASSVDLNRAAFLYDCIIPHIIAFGHCSCEIGHFGSSFFFWHSGHIVGRMPYSSFSVKVALSIDIGHEVRAQNQMLREMDDDFDSTSGFLSTTMGRVLKLARAGHNQMCIECNYE